MEINSGNNQRDTTADDSSCSALSAGGEEEADEPSSSQHLVSELDTFRQEWKKELDNANLARSNPDDDYTPDGILKKAENLFESGIHAESNGNFTKAISFYRKAVQLDPDIEFKLARRDEKKKAMNDESTSPSGEISADSSDDEYVEEGEKFDEEQLEAHLELSLSGHRICRPAKKIKNTHISELPPEVFNQILKWVVSGDLDCHSLEQVSMVCRGFYFCTRDPALWRLTCLRVWGSSCTLTNKYSSWRNMFIYRPHLWFHGAYISKASYIRYGEASFQDSHYRPCYIVAYYRYLRFFPDGSVIMLTTPETPSQSLSKLQHRGQHPHVLTGHFCLVGGNSFSAVLQRSKSGAVDTGYRARNRRSAPAPTEETYHIELEIRPVKQLPNVKLRWIKYSLHRKFRSGEETVSELETTLTGFPPFWFSRVRSFHSDSQSPLQ